MVRFVASAAETAPITPMTSAISAGTFRPGSVRMRSSKKFPGLSSTRRNPVFMIVSSCTLG